MLTVAQKIQKSSLQEILIRWRAIYPVDSTVQHLNNQGQKSLPTGNSEKLTQLKKSQTNWKNRNWNHQ